MKDINNDGDTYRKKFKFNNEELKYFLKEIQENITNNASPRENAKEVIDKLKNDGHQIYIITARDSEFHDDPYMYSKNWLDKNKIYYDKLIVNARNKKDVCEKEEIDLFIDDQPNNCLQILNAGIKAIMIIDNDDNFDGIINLKNWNDIYNFINGLE